VIDKPGRDSSLAGAVAGRVDPIGDCGAVLR
jgi:hypothetical protein